MAQAAWETGNNYTISPAQALAGKLPTKNITLAQQCQNAPLTGGTFYQMDPNSASVDMIASGSFLIVSSLLARETGNSTYQDAATNSFQFMISHLYTSSNTVVDGISVDSCQLATLNNIANTALFIEGTAILGNITKNSTLQNLANDLTQTAIANVAWQDPRGILKNDGASGGGEEGIARLVRALAAVYNISSNDSALQNYIRAFVAVQYNALVDLAGSNDIYSGNWLGPPPSSYKYGDGIAAADVLIAGLAIGNVTTPTPVSPNPTGTPPKHKSNVGAIVGGIVGGIVILILLALLILMMRRRRRYSSIKAPVFTDIDDDSDAVHEVAPIPNPVTFETEPFQLPERPSRPTEKQNTDSLRSTVSPVPPSTNPPTSVASSSAPARSTTSGDDDQATLQNQASQPVQESQEGRTVTIGSLLMQLNDLMQRGNHNRADDENESPPAYTRSNPV